MKIDSERQFGPDVINGYTVRAKRYEQADGRVAWHIIAPPSAFGDEYWLEGDKLFRARVDRMQNGMVSLSPQTTSLGLPAKHEEAIRVAVKQRTQQ